MRLKKNTQFLFFNHIDISGSERLHEGQTQFS